MARTRRAPAIPAGATVKADVEGPAIAKARPLRDEAVFHLGVVQNGTEIVRSLCGVPLSGSSAEVSAAVFDETCDACVRAFEPEKAKIANVAGSVRISGIRLKPARKQT